MLSIVGTSLTASDDQASGGCLMPIAVISNSRQQIRVVLAALLAALISGVVSVLALPATASGGLVSDDFFGGLDTGRWRVVDPVGDGSVSVVGAGTGDARLAIGVPGGVSHDAWGGDGSVRVLQDVRDVDFEVLAKFDSVPTGVYADQGLQVRASGSWLRFSVYAEKNGRLMAFAARTTGTSSAQVLKREVGVPSGGQMWLRVTRVGSRFTYAYSPDGQTWTTIGSVTHDMVVAQLGPYAGNAGGHGAVGHTARVDYVFDTAAPISPEDGGLGGGAADTTSPSISGVTATPAARSARVRWVTDEPTTGRVEFGPTQSYGKSVAVTSPATTHEVTLPDLSPATTYHYRVVATDLAGNQSTTANATLTTTAESSGDGPLIDLWHEGTLTIGANGTTQPWANVLGNVSDSDGVAELSYTLNLGSSRRLNLGPDERRLQDKGDFNADIATSALRPGDNSVVLTATDSLGHRTTLSTTVRLVTGAGPGVPYTLEWSDGLPVQQQATVVDGDWRVVDRELRTTQVGYDRLVALGDVSWRDYEVSVPVSVRSIGPKAGTTSGAALLGLGLRWQGHNGSGSSSQPAWKFFPVGAYVWCKFHHYGPRLEILGNDNDPYVRVPPDPPTVDFGVRYIMKARVETLTDGTSRYAYKMWPQSQPEPAGWALDVVDTGPATGSVVLIAHHVDASFGTVTVTPLG